MAGLDIETLLDEKRSEHEFEHDSRANEKTSTLLDKCDKANEPIENPVTITDSPKDEFRPLAQVTSASISSPTIDPSIEVSEAVTELDSSHNAIRDITDRRPSFTPGHYPESFTELLPDTSPIPEVASPVADAPVALLEGYFPANEKSFQELKAPKGTPNDSATETKDDTIAPDIPAHVGGFQSPTIEAANGGGEATPTTLEIYRRLTAILAQTLPPPKIKIQSATEDSMNNDLDYLANGLSNPQDSLPPLELPEQARAPVLGPPDESDISVLPQLEKQMVPIRKRTLYVRKARNLALQKPILQAILGRDLAGTTKPVLRMLAKGEEIVPINLDSVSDRSAVS